MKKGYKRCEVCRMVFPLHSDEVYIVREKTTTGLAACFSGEELLLFDAIDCPFCSCQNRLTERLRKEEPTMEESENPDATSDMYGVEEEEGNYE